jgi:hypothetical protein
MVTATQAPSSSTIKRLFAVSGNRCAFPKCTAGIVVGDTVIGEVCHIKAASRNGPRFDECQTPEERHGFDNLILMCANHHTVIDADDEAYSVERLLRMKSGHEAASSPLPEAAAAAGAAAISINQSGGITAHSVSVQNLHLYGAAGSPIGGAPAEGREANALSLFGPELARILAHQIRALERANVNFICASTAQAAPPDHWTTFQPRKPTLYPAAPQVQDLGAADSSLLAEFYNMLEEIDELITSWRAAETVWDMNVWNFLMQKIERSVSAGVVAVERFCPGRQYDSTMPSAGTLTDRAAFVSSAMRQSLAAHIERFNAKVKQAVPKRR